MVSPKRDMRPGSVGSERCFSDHNRSEVLRSDVVEIRLAILWLLPQHPKWAKVRRRLFAFFRNKLAFRCKPCCGTHVSDDERRVITAVMLNGNGRRRSSV